MDKIKYTAAGLSAVYFIFWLYIMVIDDGFLMLIPFKHIINALKGAVFVVCYMISQFNFYVKAYNKGLEKYIKVI